MSASGEHAGAGAQGRRVLVVDDNRDSAESMAVLLRLLGHEARTVFHGEEVVPAALEFEPELILLDIGLPGLDGYEVARRVRAQPSLAGVRIAAMSGYGSDEDRARSSREGFDHHFTKPVDLAAVERAIASLPRAESSRQ